MPVDFVSTGALTTEPSGRRRLFGDAARLLMRAASPERRHVRVAVAWLMLAAGLEALGPAIGKWLIDDYLLPRNAQVLEIAGLLLGALVAGMLASWLRYGQLVRLAGVAMRSVQRVREEVYRHVLRLPMSFFDRAITGQLVSRVTNDTEAVKTLYVQVLFVMLDSLIVLTGTSIAMLWLDWRLMLVVAGLLPVSAVIVTIYQRIATPAVVRNRELRSELNAQMAESISGMQVLQASNATARFRERFGGVNEAHYQSRQRELRANAWLLRPLLDFLNEGAIDIEQLDFGYQSGNPVLHELNLRIAPGSFHGIVGHTGSGKTTLLSLLLRFYPAPAGAIRIDGTPLESIGEEHFRASIGVVPQEPFLLAATARENIAMGRALTSEQIEAAARAAHIHEFIAGLEHGYDTPLGEGGARLSVGQKQLVAIARALAGELMAVDNGIYQRLYLLQELGSDSNFPP